MKRILGFVAMLIVGLTIIQSGSALAIAPVGTSTPAASGAPTNVTTKSGELETTATPVTSDCTLNGEPVDCNEVTKAVKPFLLGFVGLVLVFVFIGLVAFVIWIIALVHLLSNPIEDKIMWVVILILLQSLGAIIYYFVVMRKFNANKRLAQPVAPVVSVSPASSSDKNTPTEPTEKSQ